MKKHNVNDHAGARKTRIDEAQREKERKRENDARECNAPYTLLFASRSSSV